jgi:hypothetical protein
MSRRKDGPDARKSQPAESEENLRQRQDRDEREGHAEGIDKAWRGPDGASGHGAYVGENYGRDMRESDAPGVTRREPYVGTRMGDWDEGQQTEGSEALPRRSRGSERRRRDRAEGH